MYFPQYGDVPRSREMTAVFGGYNHRLSCAEGEFYDMKNMTTDYYPILSPRAKRRRAWDIESGMCTGMISTENGLYWVDLLKLYREGVKVSDQTLPSSYVGSNNMTKMGTSIVFAEGTTSTSKVSYNTDTMEIEKLSCRGSSDSSDGIFMQPSTADGAVIHVSTNEGDPVDGEYRAAWVDGKRILRQWSESTSTWVSVPTSHFYIDVAVPSELKKGDCVKVVIDFKKYTDGGVVVLDVPDAAKSLFPTEEEDSRRSVETYVTEIIDKTDEHGTKKEGLILPGVLTEYLTCGAGVVIERIIPDMDFVVECDNRLWGAAWHGHEIYSCKLGDFKNWRLFRGISTDSYAVTIGSDGGFTGAITYLNTPIFFKENSMVRVYPSGTGAHQVKETKCRGVQFYCHRSLCIINEVLYYKSNDCICAFDGSLPVSVSENFGEVRYDNAVAGTIGNKYYINMLDENGVPHMFVYDVVKRIWTKEDSIRADWFCRHGDDLYMASKDKMYTLRGTEAVEGAELENDFEWYVESGMIGFNTPDNKYVSKMTIRLSMEPGTNVSVYMQYDSSGEWEHVFNMSGTGTKSVNVPILPRRCDHFRYKISGVGDCKIFSITKTVEEGSDIR